MNQTIIKLVSLFARSNNIISAQKKYLVTTMCSIKNNVFSKCPSLCTRRFTNLKTKLAKNNKASI